MKYKKIAFIGMMGSGKSTIAKLVSKKINIELFDSDCIFEEKFKITIKDFFGKYSEYEFRKEETKILEEIIKKDNFILSCGGGIVTQEENRNMLFNSEILTIYLSAQPSTIYERIKNDTSRPLLQVENPKKEIEKIIDQRIKYYSMANQIIKTDNKTPQEIIEEIQWIL